jgi:arylformamidase
LLCFELGTQSYNVIACKNGLIREEKLMKILDVTLTISPEMTTWPGDSPVSLERFRKIEEGANSNASRLDMAAHTGTHVDAPYHFLMDGKGVDQLNLEILTGPALVLEFDEQVEVINAQALKMQNIPVGTLRVLFKTRNSLIWANHEKEFQPGFVGVDLSGANFLVERGIRLVGIDYLSVSPYKKSRPTHEALLRVEMVIIEGLDLSGVPAGIYQLYCLPLKLKGADGAPARVILMGDE